MGTVSAPPGAEKIEAGASALPPGAIALPPLEAAAPKASAPAEPNRSALTAALYGRGAAERGAGATPGAVPDPTPAPPWVAPAAEIALTAPLIGYGGGALGNLAAKLAPFLGKAAPAVGRVGAVGLKSAADAKMEGKDIVSLPVLLDIAVAGLTEAALGGAGKVIKRFGAPARGYKYATEAPQQALEALRSRLGHVKSIVVPALGPGKMTIDEAVKKLAKLTGPDYQQVRGELASILQRLDRQRMIGGPRPFAGQVLKQRTADFRMPPSGFATAAEGTRRGLANPMGRAAADATITEDIPGTDLPVGAAMAAAPRALWQAILRRITP